MTSEKTIEEMAFENMKTEYPEMTMAEYRATLQASLAGIRKRLADNGCSLPNDDDDLRDFVSRLFAVMEIQRKVKDEDVVEA